MSTGRHRVRLKWLALTLAVSAAVLITGVGGADAAFPGANGKIAFSASVGGTSEIFVVNPDGTDQMQLTNNSVDDLAPSWSADGTRIAFFRGIPNSDIYVMNADGSGETQLTASPTRDEEPSWSPDGTRIVFWSDRDGDPEIYVMNVDGSGVTQLTANEVADGYPMWSPDGSRIAFASGRDGNWEIFVMNADGSGATQLTFTDLLANLYPDWSPDGTKIAFERWHLGLGIGGIWTTNADGSGETQLTSGIVDRRPAWSPDGMKIAFATSGGVIAVMNADGSGATAVTPGGDAAWQPLVTQTAFADLALTLEGSGKTANTKKQYTYTITVENNGPAPAAGAVVTDVLDANEQFQGATTSHGACETVPAVGASGTIECDVGQLAVSEVATIAVTVALPAKKSFGSSKPEVSNTASVGGTTADAVPGNNLATLVTNVVGP